MICRKPTVLSMQKLIANRWVEDWEASNGHTKDTTRLFHGPWHVSVGEHICGGPNLNGWWVIARTSSKWGKFWLRSWIWPWRSRSITPPKTIGILTKVFYTHDPNLVILAWTGDELSRGQTWWRTDWRTDGRTQATTIPEGQYWKSQCFEKLYIETGFQMTKSDLPAVASPFISCEFMYALIYA